MNAAFIGEAPGRLDFLGGVADYSGALVLQMATQCKTRVGITPLEELFFEFYTVGELPFRMPSTPLADVAKPGADWAVLRQQVESCGVPFWAKYPLGCLLALNQELGWRPTSGLRFRIESEVPQSMGVSSSAALEIATLRALVKLSELELPGTLIAHLGQRAENLIVGAPCGLMDQLASAFGREGCLLPILCRPDVLHDPVALPSGVIAVGWPSGVRHAVADSPYATARAATFMGKKWIERPLGRKLSYTSEVRPIDFRRQIVSALPGQTTGAEFLAEFGSVDDPLSRIDPARTYPVAAATSFAVEENDRCFLAISLLGPNSPETRETSLRWAGNLMIESHQGYSAMGLGCPETDAMVRAIASVGAESGIYGARISGGGSGGTVVVLLEEASLGRLQSIARSVMGKEPTFIR